MEVYRALKASDITDDLLNKVGAVCTGHHSAAWVSPDLRHGTVSQRPVHAWSPAHRSSRLPDPAHVVPCPSHAVMEP